MASSSRFNHVVQSPPLHFLNLILPQTLTAQKLVIPSNFVRKHGEALQTNEVCLQVGISGVQWKVGLEKCDEKVLFAKGWEEFATFYSLQSGYFLTFRYDGNFCFNVIIFDKNGCEIQYPMPKFKTEIQDQFQDPDVIILETTPPCFADHNRKKSEASSSHQPLRVINPSFSVTMGMSYTRTQSKRHYLNIPLRFAKIYIQEAKEITLVGIDGRIWKIWCDVRSWDERTKVEMKDGWIEFARDNNLKIGDICFFELIEIDPQMLFKVEIFRPLKDV